MKKNIFLFYFTLCVVYGSSSVSQNLFDISQIPVDTITKLISYKEVVQEKGSADELYNRAIEWFNSFYKNPTGVTRIRDPQNHKITGVAQFKIKKTDKDGVNIDAGNIAYTIILEFKDNRYRYELTNFNHKRTSYFPLERWLDPKDPQYNSDCPEFIKQVHNYSQELSKSLKQGMKPKVFIEDNW